ncbi:MAG: T9SS C-terminal target domain-containing protein, partial [Calditrichaeota bacterium]
LGANVPGGLNQLAFLAIPGGAVNFVRLVGNTSGVIGPGDSDVLTVRLYGLEIPDTSYSATLRIRSNDPFNPIVDIPIQVNTKDTMVVIQPPEQIPQTVAVYQNYPNPFNPETIILYQLPRDEIVQIVIYDILGRMITTLINKKMKSGYYKIKWNGRDATGRRVPSGIYFYKFKAGAYERVMKMMLIK